MNTRNKSRKCKIIHNHLLHVWDFHLWYFSVQPIFISFVFCDFWTLFFMTTSYLQIPEEFPLPLRPVLLQHQHLPAYKHSGFRSVQITIRIFFFITVDSLFNMKYLPLIHCFELNRENIKLRAPNFCYIISYSSQLSKQT